MSHQQCRGMQKARGARAEADVEDHDPHRADDHVGRRCDEEASSAPHASTLQRSTECEEDDAAQRQQGAAHRGGSDDVSLEAEQSLLFGPHHTWPQQHERDAQADQEPADQTTRSAVHA